MQFIDLKAQQERIRPEIDRRIKAVLDHGKYIMGPEVAELEEKLAAFVGVKHCIGMASGTDALLAALMALEIGQGDEVITTPFTFIATGEVISLLGATPVFVDIDPRTYNIDPSKIEAAITPKTRAIMPVSLYGQPADMTDINTVAQKHGLPVIEDGAQSLGATHHGKQSCGLSTIGCTSFMPSKPLGAYGDAGACFTDDDELAQRMRQLRIHGADRKYHHPLIGFNGRLDTMQAAVLLAKLEIFPAEIKARQEAGRRYSQHLSAQCEDVEPPYIAPENTTVYAQYTVAVADRAAYQEKLQAANVPVAVHYPLPLYRQPAYATLGVGPEGYPVTEAAAGKVMSLPMHPYLTNTEQAAVVSALSKAKAGAQPSL